MKPSTAPDVGSDLEPPSTPAHGSEPESESGEPELEQAQTTTDEIPPTMKFPNDPHGYRETIYEILYEASETTNPSLTSEDIRGEITKRIKDGDFNSPPPSTAQVTSHLIQIEKVLKKRGLSILAADKQQKDRNKASTYQLHRTDRNVHTFKKQPDEKEDAEINKPDYIERIKSSLAHAEYMVAREIARHPNLTFEDLGGTIGDEKKLHEILERLNTIGSSSALPQKFKIKKTNGKYNLVVFKPQKQGKKVPSYEPKIIPELLAVETETVFGIRKKVQEIINTVLSEARIIETKGIRVRTSVEALRAQQKASVLISSKVKDIIKTLETIISQKPETERIAGQIRDRLKETIEKYERVKGGEFPAILRAELRRV